MARGARDVFTPKVILALAALILAAGVGHALAGTDVGTFRQDFAQRLLYLIFAAWALFHFLRGGSVNPRVNYPVAEAALIAGGVTGLVALVGFGLGRWTMTLVPGDPGLTMTAVGLSEWIVVGLALVTLRPRPTDLGLTRFPQIRNIFLVLLAGAIGYVMAVHLDFSNLERHLMELPGRILVVVLPAELVFRALLQTRLELLTSEGWAILAQAGLFHVVRIPLNWVMGDPWYLAPLDLFPHLVVGILTGIVWARTRNLYLVVALHAMIPYGPTLTVA